MFSRAWVVRRYRAIRCRQLEEWVNGAGTLHHEVTDRHRQRMSDYRVKAFLEGPQNPFQLLGCDNICEAEILKSGLKSPLVQDFSRHYWIQIPVFGKKTNTIMSLLLLSTIRVLYSNVNIIFNILFLNILTLQG